MAFEYFLTDVLVRWGFRDFILPFVLVFTVIYAIFEKVHLFGKDGYTSRYHAVIAMVMGLAVVIPHVTGMYPPGKDIVEIFWSSLPQISAVIVAIIMALIMIGVFGSKVKLKGDNWWSGLIIVASFLIVIYVFGTSAGWWYAPNWLYWLTADTDLQALIITILVFAVIIHFITHEDKKSKKDEESDDAYKARLKAMKEAGKIYQLSKLLENK